MFGFTGTPSEHHNPIHEQARKHNLEKIAHQDRYWAVTEHDTLREQRGTTSPAERADRWDDVATVYVNLAALAEATQPNPWSLAFAELDHAAAATDHAAAIRGRLNRLRPVT